MMAAGTVATNWLSYWWGGDYENLHAGGSKQNVDFHALSPLLTWGPQVLSVIHQSSQHKTRGC